MILVCLWAAGCTDSSQDNTPTCSCSSDQICENGKCLDTCSEHKPCANKADCVNNICRGGSTTTCKVGTKQCSDDRTKVLVCNNGHDFETDEECGAGNICDSAVCVPDDCKEGVKRCRQNNVEVCVSNAFRIYTECELPSVCDETQMDCVTPSVCIDDVKRCGPDGNVQICDKGGWVQIMKCPAASPCDQSTLKCANDVKCQNNEKSCSEDNNLMVCEGTQWSKKPCAENTICYNSDCREKCTPNDSACTSSNSYHKCNAMGIWVDTNCASGLVCKDDNGEASCEGSCSEGAYSCEENVLKRCESNEINVIQPCGDRATCSESEGRCIPNCGNGQLNSGEECDGSVPPGASCQTEMGENYTGTLSCTSACTIDTSACTIAPTCGNGRLDSGEECDTTVPSGKTCETEKGSDYTGSLSCTSSCTIDTGNCTKSSVTPTDWDYTQTFAQLKTISNQYKTENIYNEYDIDWTIKARTQMTQTSNGVTTDYSIDGQGVILKYDKDVPNYITASGLTKGIKVLAFDYRSWGGASDNGIVKITAGSFSEELNFKKDQTTPEVHTSTINANVTEFTIESTKGGRIIIDNVRWTNQ